MSLHSFLTLVQPPFLGLQSLQSLNPNEDGTPGNEGVPDQASCQQKKKERGTRQHKPVP